MTRERPGAGISLLWLILFFVQPWTILVWLILRYLATGSEGGFAAADAELTQTIVVVLVACALGAVIAVVGILLFG